MIITQHCVNIYHKLNNIFRLVLCWFEGSQSGNDDDVILYMARHHLPTDFLVFWHRQIQPCVRILNLPRKENTCRVQAYAQRLLTHHLRGSSSKLSFQQDNSQTLPQQFSCSAATEIRIWPASCILSQRTWPLQCHWPPQTKCQGHSFSGNRSWGVIQSRTSPTGVEHAVLSSRADEKIPWSLITACSEAKVCSLQFMPSPIHLSFVFGHPQEWHSQ